MSASEASAAPIASDPIPEYANYVPPGRLKASASNDGDGWPAWASFKPGPKAVAAIVASVAVLEQAVAVPADESPTHHYECCGKDWNGPRQLRLHRNAKACPNHVPR